MIHADNFSIDLTDDCVLNNSYTDNHYGRDPNSRNNTGYIQHKSARESNSTWMNFMPGLVRILQGNGSNLSAKQIRTNALNYRN